jgi:hypothetical protein
MQFSCVNVLGKRIILYFISTTRENENLTRFDKVIKNYVTLFFFIITFFSSITIIAFNNSA